MRDIAGGGIGIKAKQILPPGSKVFVKVSDMTNCMAEATVVWARDVPFSILSAYKFRMGVKLGSTTSNFNEFLKTNIESGLFIAQTTLTSHIQLGV